MILGIGTDIIEIQRMDKFVKKKNYAKKIYTENEIVFACSSNRTSEVYAGTFASKEAVSKSFGTGFRNFSVLDIEIIRNDLGKPYVVLHKNAKIIAEKMGVKNIFLSISHTDNVCVAFCVLEGESYD